MTENHSQSHFSPFQIDTQLFSKWPPAAILEAQFLPKSIGTYLYSMKLIGAFLIKLWSAQVFHHIVTKWPPAAILVFRYSPQSIGFFHSRSSMAVYNMNLIHVLVSPVT